MPEFKQHIYEFGGTPTEAPPTIGAHAVNTVTNDTYISVGVDSSSDWRKVWPRRNYSEVVDVQIIDFWDAENEEMNPVDMVPWLGKTIRLVDDGRYLAAYKDANGWEEGDVGETEIYFSDLPVGTAEENVELIGAQIKIVNGTDYWIDIDAYDNDYTYFGRSNVSAGYPPIDLESGYYATPRATVTLTVALPVANYADPSDVIWQWILSGDNGYYDLENFNDSDHMADPQ